MLNRTAAGLKIRERIWRRKKSEWTGAIEIKTSKKFLAVDEACVAIFDILQALNGEHLSGLYSQHRGL